MTSREELYDALRNAHAAGDVQAATRLAQYIQSLPAEAAPMATPTSPAIPARSNLEAAKDVGASLVGGLGSLIQLPGQLYGLATGDFEDTGFLGAGKKVQEFGKELKSEALKAKESARAKAIQEAEKQGQVEAFGAAFGETIKDPALLTSFLFEQVPQLLIPFGAAKLAKLGIAAKTATATEGLTGMAAQRAAEEVAKQAGLRATTAAVGAGAVQQGADVGAQAYEDIFKELKRKGASDEDAAEATLNLARSTAASAAVMSLLAQRLPGAKTLEKTLAGVPGGGGVLAGATKGALGEGLSEVVEETGGKLAANIAKKTVSPEQSLLEGLGQTAGMAAVGGVGIGGVSGGIGGMQPKPAKPVAEPRPEESAPPKEAAPTLEPEIGRGGLEETVTPLSQLTPAEQRELQMQRDLYASKEPKAEDVLEEVRGRMQVAPATTPEDLTRIRDEHETAVINALLEQDKKMQSVSDLARANAERMSQLESMEAATKDADARVREARLMGRVQSLIDENIPFASTAITDINRKFGLIGEAPLSDAERARVQNIMTMAQGFTDFVKLPSLPVREQDRFAENQAMEALIKERGQRGKVQPKPVRTEALAPGQGIQETPVSRGIEEGAAVRPEGGVKPGITEDRQRVAPTVVEPLPALEPISAKPTSKQEAKQAEQPAKSGADTQIITPDGNKYAAQWQVVDADSIKASMVEGKSQPRDRQRAASDAQISAIAQNPDFDRLSDTSKTMDYGAPTLTANDEIVGGNGRFEGVNRAYETEAGEQYKQRLLENAQRLGLDPDQISGMKRPILVRKLSAPADTRKLAIQSNVVAGLKMSDMEQAALDSERMKGLERLTITDNGDIPLSASNLETIRDALKDYTKEEVADMMAADGGLSQTGLRRVKNAILHKAYGKSETLARLVESPDPDLKNVGTALMRASGNMSKMMDAIRSGAIPSEYNIIEDLTGAIETLSSLRASGMKVQEFLNQTELFADGISGPARAILNFMDNNLRSAKTITDFLNDYAQAVLSAESTKGGLFEEVKLPSKQETVERAAEKYESQRKAAKSQQGIFEQPTGEVREEGGKKPEGEGRVTERDEKASEVDEAQAKDAGTPDTVTKDMEEHAFGKEVGAEPYMETKVRAGKATIEAGMRQPPNKTLKEAVLNESTDGVINALKESKNPIIANIAKLAEKRGSWFYIGMMPDNIKRRFSKATGVFIPDQGAIFFRTQKAAESEHIAAHEIAHALTVSAIDNPTEQQKPAVARLNKLFEHVKTQLGERGRKLYGLTDLREFVAEANSNVNFQYKLRQIKYQNQTAWGAFTKFVAQILGLGNDTALTEILALTEELASPQSARNIYEPGKVFEMRGERTPEEIGKDALKKVTDLGLGVQEAPKNKFEEAKAMLKKMGENPDLTKEEAKAKFAELMDKFETFTFSADAKFENDVRRGIKEDAADLETFVGTMLSVSQSGAVHADAVATQAVLRGKAEYSNEYKKFIAVDDKNNLTAIAGQLDKIAEKYGLTKEEAQRIAHTYFVAKNYGGILKRNAAIEAEVEQLRAEGKKEEAKDRDDALVYVSEEQEALVEPGKDLVNSIPELAKLVDTWNGIRKNFIGTMVESGLWSEEYATAMLDNIDYVPFYREEQVEAEEGPQQMIRGLQVKAKEHKLKGSANPVNDVFDNMARWMQYAMNRAIRNHKALQMIDVATELKLGDKPMAEPVTEAKRGMNIARVWRDGKQELYNMADPLYLPAFQSLGAVAIPAIKYFTAISNMLRRTVVMYPLFSVGQLSQDSVAAIFASGLKPQFALKIPVLAVKEFVKTYLGKSTTHDELVRTGVVGVRDFNAAVARDDAEIIAGIKAPRGVAQKINYTLERIAMSADNAVRQAVYLASEDAGMSKAESLEKAFEVINFRRRGSSKLLNLMGQTVPFFYAYLSAQRVAYRVLTGVGISPSERKAALETLATTTGAVMALTFLYSMANGDDEDYKKTPGTVRDRSLVIPGSGGLRIPLRPDFFLLPKIIAEHSYQLITDKGYTDGAKFRKGMADVFANAVLSPNPVPQAFKPLVEVGINYSFFEGKPIVGFFEQNKDAGRQFGENTSELAKYLGQFGASPQKVDHLIRGYFGSVGGAVLWATNFFVEGEPGVPRPSITWSEAAATLPGVGAFRAKPNENALKIDFYELRDTVEKAKNTYDDIKRRSPEGIKAFVEDEKNLARLAMEKKVTKIGDHLAKVRRAIQQISNMPESQMTASEKQARIKELREVETKILKAVDVKKLREQAKM